MRVIVVGTERNLFKEGSPARARIAGYGKLFEELHLIVFTGRGVEFKEQKIAENVFVYPTRSWFRFLYVSGAEKIAKSLAQKFEVDPPKDGRTVVSAQDPFESGLAGKRVADVLKAKFHIQIHTDLFSPNFSSSALNRARVSIARRLIPKADAIRVVSEDLKERLVSSGLCLPERISVLPIYVDTNLISDDTPIDPAVDLRKRFPALKFIAVMVSRLAPEKDIGLAIKAIAVLSKENPYLGLVIVGDGKEQGNLKRLARRLGARSHVHFVPWQNNIDSVYKSANAFLLTSSFEGYGMSLIEAALSGVPIISTKVGIAKEFKDGKEALLCDVGDVECLIKKMRLLIHDHALRQLLKTSARMAVLSRLPDKEKYDQLYKESLELALDNS